MLTASTAFSQTGANTGLTGIVTDPSGGWSLSGIGTFQSGRPFTIVDEDYSGILYASTAPRPNLGAGMTHGDLKTEGGYSERVGGFLNRAALASAGAQFGNLGRNVMRAPPAAAGRLVDPQEHTGERTGIDGLSSRVL